MFRVNRIFELCLKAKLIEKMDAVAADREVGLIHEVGLHYLRKAIIVQLRLVENRNASFYKLGYQLKDRAEIGDLHKNFPVDPIA